MEKRLFRNEYDKTVAGVASGLASYMEVDVTIIRILFVLSTIFLAGAGILVYIIMWIVVPVNNDPTAKFSKFNQYFQQNQNNQSMYNSPNAFNNPQNAGEQTKWNTENATTGFNTPQDFSNFQKTNDTSKTIIGLVLLILGIYFLLHTLNLVPNWFSIWKIYKLWPLAIIAIGVSLIFKNRQKTEWDNFKQTTQEAQQKTDDKSVSETEITDEKNSDEQVGHS